MFGDLGFPELMLILVIALLLFGGGKLPEVGRSLGQAIREFRGAMREAASGEVEEKKEK